MAYSFLLSEPVPVKVHDYISNKRVGVVLDIIFKRHNIGVYKIGCYFAIQRVDGAITMISFMCLVDTAIELIEKDMSLQRTNVFKKIELMVYNRRLKKFKTKLYNTRTNRICLKCGSNGVIIDMDSKMSNSKINILCCTNCRDRHSLDYFSSYKVH